MLTKVPAVSRHHAERLCQPVQVTHERLLTDHLGAVVAHAEGRELRVPAVHSPADPTVAPGPKLPGSDVAARLRAFGTNGHDPRGIVR